MSSGFWVQLWGVQCIKNVLVLVFQYGRHANRRPWNIILLTTHLRVARRFGLRGPSDLGRR